MNIYILTFNVPGTTDTPVSFPAPQSSYSFIESRLHSIKLNEEHTEFGPVSIPKLEISSFVQSLSFAERTFITQHFHKSSFGDLLLYGDLHLTISHHTI